MTEMIHHTPAGAGFPGKKAPFFPEDPQALAYPKKKKKGEKREGAAELATTNRFSFQIFSAPLGKKRALLGVRPFFAACTAKKLMYPTYWPKFQRFGHLFTTGSLF